MSLEGILLLRLSLAKQDLTANLNTADGVPGHGKDGASSLLVDRAAVAPLVRGAKRL